MAEPSSTTVQFGNIFIASRAGVNQGPLKVSGGGMTWRSANGGKTIEIKKDDMEGLYWTKNSRVCQLGVRVKDGPTTNFLGFRDKDLEGLREIAKNQLGKEIKDLPMSISGRNWGAIAIHNGSLMFSVDNKVALDIPLRDISQAQQSKDDIMMEFHQDDTAGDDKHDVLCEIAFHVPASNEAFRSEDMPAAKNLLDQVLQHTDTGAAATDEAVCMFGDVAILNPRGRFEIELHLSFLSMVGQTQDFKIRYGSIQRLFILPKPNTPHTLVVISLDPPIRKGQTYYTHVLCQFPSEEQETIDLDITPEQLASKNEKCGGKLEASFTGPVYEVFAKALRGLSGAKISRPGGFHNSANDGSSIRCSYKADDGHLYPLDRAFFYIHKPPMLLPFDEVDSVEFARQGGGVVSSRTFDLVVRMKTEVEHQFRNINRTEWQTLFDFINSKKLRIENLSSAAQGPGGPGKALDVDDDFDPGMRRAEAEIDTEEDDEDFAAGSGSGSESEDIDSDGDGSDDAEMVAEEGISVDAVMSKKGKRARDDAGPSESPAEPKVKKEKTKAPSAEKPAKKVKGEPKEPKEAGAKEKKPRKKKDKNAPKKNLSAFMFFSNDMRAKVKEENPGIAFGEVGKVLGEKWKALSAEDKVQYDEQASADKERYATAMAAYKSTLAGDAADEGGDAEDDDADAADE